MTCEVNGVLGPDEEPRGEPEHCTVASDGCHDACGASCSDDACGSCACPCDDCGEAREYERAQLDEDEPLGVAEAVEGWWRP